MGRNLDSKCSQCRRVGEKLFLKGERCNTPKCAMVKRNYPPGFHGPTRGRRKISDYGTQLMEKQKAKKYYNMMEKQFRLTFEKASNKSGDAGKNFLRLLEMRLDNVVFRLGMGRTREQSRQLVTHGHVLVDDKKVDIPSFQVAPGQVINFRAKTAKKPRIAEEIKNNRQIGVAMAHLELDSFGGRLLHLPKPADLPQDVDIAQVLEYYHSII